LACLMLQVNTQFWLLDYPKAQKIYEHTQKLFPGNIVSKHIGGISLRFQGEIDLAEKCILSVREAVSQSPQMDLVCSYELGTTAIKYSNWKKGIEYFEFFMQNNKTENIRCMCAHELGVSYFFENEVEKARKCFKLSVKWVRPDIPWEQYMARKSKQFLATEETMTQFDMVFLKPEKDLRLLILRSVLNLF